MKKNINDVNRIIAKYTAGKATVEETNADLKLLGSDLRLDPGKNLLTEAEIAAATAESAETANGFGLLDMGLGKPSKVEVRDGKLADNHVGAMEADFYIAGRVFAVKGDALTEK